MNKHNITILIYFFRALLFKTLVPQKADDLFAAKDRATAPEEFVRLFLLKEESAQRHETKTDNILDGKEDGEGGKETKKDAKQSQEDFIDETVKKRELHIMISICSTTS